MLTWKYQFEETAHTEQVKASIDIFLKKKIHKCSSNLVSANLQVYFNKNQMLRSN